MREIEFRGKDIATNEWVYGYLYRLKGVYTISKNIRYDDETPIFIDTVGQYTGIKDKNGTKIFEGDILKDQWNTIYVVKYKNSGFYIYRNNGRNGYSKIASWNGNKEVIGNIHDNSELLEEKV